MPIQKDKKGLTIKQKKFVKAYIDNDGNGTQAALATYDTTDYDTANQIAIENLQRPTVKQAIEDALNNHGITIEKATQPIADGLQATKTIPTSDGFVEGIDHSTRLKASGMALKLLGADQKETQGTTFNLNFNKGSGASFDMGKFKK